METGYNGGSRKQRSWWIKGTTKDTVWNNLEESSRRGQKKYQEEEGHNLTGGKRVDGGRPAANRQRPGGQMTPEWSIVECSRA